MNEFSLAICSPEKTSKCDLQETQKKPVKSRDNPKLDQRKRSNIRRFSHIHVGLSRIKSTSEPSKGMRQLFLPIRDPCVFRAGKACINI